MRSTLELVLIVVASAVIAPTLDARATRELKPSTCVALRHMLAAPEETAARHWHALRCVRGAHQ